MQLRRFHVILSSNIADDLSTVVSFGLQDGSDAQPFKQGKDMHDQLLLLPTVLINALLSEK